MRISWAWVLTPDSDCTQDAFRFASAGLSVSSDGGLLFGMERPVAQGTAATSVQRLDLKSMTQLAPVSVRPDSGCTAMATGGAWGPLLACLGEGNPIMQLDVASDAQQAASGMQLSQVGPAYLLASNPEVTATAYSNTAPALDMVAQLGVRHIVHAHILRLAFVSR